MTLETWLNYSSGTTLIGTAGLVILAGPGRLRSIGGANTSANTDYFLVGVNKATAPVADDACVFAIPLSMNTSFGTSTQALDMGLDCWIFATGIAFAISTLPQKVALGTATCFVWAQYR